MPLYRKNEEPGTTVYLQLLGDPETTKGALPMLSIVFYNGGTNKGAVELCYNPQGERYWDIYRLYDKIGAPEFEAALSRATHILLVDTASKANAQ